MLVYEGEKNSPSYVALSSSLGVLQSVVNVCTFVRPFYAGSFLKYVLPPLPSS